LHEWSCETDNIDLWDRSVLLYRLGSVEGASCHIKNRRNDGTDEGSVNIGQPAIHLTRCVYDRTFGQTFTWG